MPKNEYFFQIHAHTAQTWRTPHEPSIQQSPYRIGWSYWLQGVFVYMSRLVLFLVTCYR